MGWFQDLLGEIPTAAVARERMEFYKDKYEALEKRLSELEAVNERLGAENEHLLERVGELAAVEEEDLQPTEKAILVCLFKSDRGSLQDVQIFRTIDADPGVVKYHLDKLEKGGLIFVGRSMVDRPNICTLSSNGRAFVVEKGLHEG